MGKKKLYIQNADAHTENPTFRVGIHGDRVLMNMNKSHGVYWPRKDGRNTHFDWEDGKNYIRGDTQHDNTLTVGGDLVVKGNIILDGDNKWIIHTPDDGRKTMYIAPWGNGDWNWGKQVVFNA